MREEIRVHMEPADQARLAAVAERYGWSGLGLTAWLLERQLDGQTPEASLDMIEAVHAMVASDRHDPVVRAWADGHRPGFTVVHAPGLVGTTVVPPVPGKDSYTLITGDAVPICG